LIALSLGFPPAPFLRQPKSSSLGDPPTLFSTQKTPPHNFVTSLRFPFFDLLILFFLAFDDPALSLAFPLKCNRVFYPLLRCFVDTPRRFLSSRCCLLVFDCSIKSTLPQPPHSGSDPSEVPLFIPPPPPPPCARAARVLIKSPLLHSFITRCPLFIILVYTAGSPVKFCLVCFPPPPCFFF